jgi:hypothetical protein
MNVMPYGGRTMAYRAKMTEHTGAKKAKGGYAGRKKEAKKESNKLRRRHSRKLVKDTSNR